jgi:hypothetical protein
MNKTFSKFSVISVDKSHKVLTVKHYTNEEEYDKDILIMHSQFDTKEEANRECRRLIRLHGGRSLV